MKKYLWICIFFIFVLVIIFFVFNQPKKGQSNYIAERTGSTIQDDKNENLNFENKDENKKNSIEDPNSNQEKELSKFSTKLPKDTKARYSNINLACETLNGTIVKKGETFSLWNVLGCPTKEKGYRKAKTFTSSGKVTQSYGGGICQVSTTIYNAVLEIKELKIKERHEHSRDVVYIKDGKDAAVSYKTADLKFKNTLDYDIEIKAKLENNKVKISIIRI